MTNLFFNVPVTVLYMLNYTLITLAILSNFLKYLIASPKSFITPHWNRLTWLSCEQKEHFKFRINDSIIIAIKHMEDNMNKLTKTLTSLTFMVCCMNSLALLLYQTYDIDEPDALTEIEQKVASVDWNKALDKPADQWQAMQGNPLPFSTENRSRSVILLYHWFLPSRIRQGELLTPKERLPSSAGAEHLPNGS